MWSIAEAVCYGLNLKGRAAVSRAKSIERNRHSPELIQRYRAAHPIKRADFYTTDAGTFLNRYAMAGAELRRDFPDGLSGKTVLEIGCGRGAFLLVIARELGARFVYGVENETERAKFAAAMLVDHGATNAMVVPKDMKAVPGVPSGSVDQIISYACFEHIHDLPGVMAESARVLKPGGHLLARFSPIWRHYYGSHLGHEIPFPWTHLLFSEPTVRKTLERLQGRTQPTELYLELNKLTMRQYRRIFAEAGLRLVELSQSSGSRLMGTLRKLPVVNEFIAGDVRLVLRKPPA